MLTRITAHWRTCTLQAISSGYTASLDYIPRPSPDDKRNQSKQQLFQFVFKTTPLVEEAEELASNVLAASLLVVHDTSGGGQDDVAELTGGKELGSPLLEVTELDGVAGVDDTALVEAAVQLDDDLAGAVVVNLLELADVA